MSSSSSFIIGDHIATGGMANVFKAYQPSLKRTVAAKQLLPEFRQNTEIVERFKLEAYSLAELQHPNIIQIYDFDDHELMFFLEFVQGVTLDELITEGKGLPVQNCVKIVSDVLAGLQYAHERNLVHRDIKPSNIFITSDGHVKISDFGIAKIIGDYKKADVKTELGQFIGTSTYASPEQCIGGVVDQRSDIYSAGILLYHLATGKQPFQGKTQEETRTMQVYHLPAQPIQLLNDIPAKLNDIIMEAIAKKPDERFQSASEFISALQELIKPDNSEIYYQEALEEFDAAMKIMSVFKRKSALLKADKLCNMALANNCTDKGCYELLDKLRHSLKKADKTIYSFYGLASACIIIMTATIVYVAKPDYGSLDLTGINQELEVFLDGKSIGSAPNVFKDITTGKHTLIVSDSEYFVSKPVEVEISKNSVTTLSIPIPSFGKVFINSGQQGLDIVIDGKKHSKTPATIKVPIGIRKIAVGEKARSIAIFEGYNDPVIFE